MKNAQGFTLIELMIVVAIIAILAAIAISQYQDYVIRSQVSEGSSLADGAKTAVAEFANNRGRFANGSGATNGSYGLAQPASIAGSYVGSVSVRGGVITAWFSGSGSQRANVAIAGASLSFSPITHAGSIEWVCNPANALKQKYVPTICRN